LYGEKLPPHDIDAEEAVIGSLLIDGAAIYKIATVLEQEEKSMDIWGLLIALPT